MRFTLFLAGAAALCLAGGASAATDYPSGYTKCAQVGSTCSMTGTHSVALGKSGSFVYATLTGSFTCLTTLFPANSFTSSAWCSVGPEATTSSSSSSAQTSSSSSSSAASSSSSKSSSSSSSSAAASSSSISSVASTATRPQLSDTVAANYTVAKYLGSWTPETISTPSSPDYTVGSSATYKTIQSAVNAAIATGSTTRKYILVSAGTYKELVFIPSGTPITLYGTGAATAVQIQLNISAPMTGTQYGAVVSAANYSGTAKTWVQGCIDKGSSTIGTTCSSMFVVQGDGFEMKNVTITNTYGEDNASSGGQDQAVALYTAADKVILDSVRLIGNQDTFWVSGTNKRVYVKSSYVAGDVDFIFGNATAVFDGSEIYYVTGRKTNGAIGAPSTESSVTYGFLFNACSFTSSGSLSGTVYFARQWPQSSLSSPVGKMIIRNSTIGSHIVKAAPWKDWSSSNPVNYGTSTNPYLGEYQNTGAGAAQ